MTTDKNNTAPDPQPAERADASVVEQIAQQWDGSQYYAPGEMVDIGAAIRRAGKRLSAELAEQQGVSLPPFPRTHYDAFGDGSEPLYTAKQMQDYARAALAATGKQQVGEVQGDALPPMPKCHDRQPDDMPDDMPGYMESALDWARDPYNCEAVEWLMENHAAIRAALAARQPGAQLAVWCGPMPESNGRQNWTAMMYHKRGDIFREGAMQIERCEYPDRVRYEANRLRYLIGERDEEPEIMKYDANLHSGYVEPPAQGIDLGPFRRPVESWKRKRERSLRRAINAGKASPLVEGLRRNLADADRLMALIDGQRGAAPGADNG